VKKLPFQKPLTAWEIAVREGTDMSLIGAVKSKFLAVVIYRHES